ncbi:MAG: spondin domain-containing protein [Flavobacteriales bacterium]|nr:spondin domain-containing protein [Flavobacteriales bacterium]
MKKILWSALILTLVATTSCKKDEENEEMTGPKTFTVTVENVMEEKDFLLSGTTGLIEPGMTAEYSFYAAPGQYLSWISMFVKSNDVFIGSPMGGVALYDGNGNALSGDITAQFSLWDAGTEVNEEPGTGANQPPNQSGPNTGDDENGTVMMLSAVGDGFSYPTISDILSVQLTYNGNSMFTLSAMNTSASASIETPFAPGVWVVHDSGLTPLFMSGSAAMNGLEPLAEDGDNSMLSTWLMDHSGLVSPFAPGAYSVGSGNGVFADGQQASSELEALAEDGDPSGFDDVFNTPVGGNGAGPLFPGSSYSFSFSGSAGDRLSLATMLVKSNDWFLGLDAVQLFNSGTALSGDITDLVKLYDAGTEVDEFAGAGMNQPLFQSGANTGTAESGTTQEEDNAGSHVPAVENIVKVTITAQ